MIQLPIDVKPENLQDVKNFCILNNVTWCHVYSESWLDGVSGTPENVQKVVEFNNKIQDDYEKYRKTKSFWWKLFN